MKKWLLLLGLLPFLPVLLSGSIFLSSDQAGAIGWQWYFDSLRAFEIPRWNPYILGGMPTFDASFGDGSYLPFILLGLTLPIQWVVPVYFILHTLLAGFGAYFLARRHFLLSPKFALVLGVAYMLNTNMISLIHAGHTGKFAVIAWLPLALYFLLQCKPLGLFAVLLAMLTTLHLQMVYFVLAGFFLYWLFRIHRYPAWRFWLPVCLALAVASPLIRPPIVYNEKYSVRGTEAKQSYEHAASWSLHPRELLQIVSPEAVGIGQDYKGPNPFKINSEYQGLTILILALIGLIRYRSRGYLFWSALAGLALLFALGAHTPVHRLAYDLVPGIKNFRAPSMVMFWFVAALWLMAAETLRRNPKWEWFAVPMVCLTFFDLFLRSTLFLIPVSAEIPREPAIEALRRDTAPFRVWCEACPPGLLEYHKIENTIGFKDQEYKEYRGYRQAMVKELQETGQSRRLDNLNVKYLLYRDQDGILQAAENKTAMPRAWIEGGTLVLLSKTYNRQAWLVVSPGGLAIFSELDFSMWQAKIDGVPAATVRTHEILRGVEVPAGRHVIVWTYHSL